MQRKKLQVFVSSTYDDMRDERQAAVEAILTAGHIPAGMELFAAGDDSQMSVIRHWIDESDVFLLILGGRYGSVEPTSGKSYIHLEYDYAMQIGKPLFAVVIDQMHLEEKVKKMGTRAIETIAPDQMRALTAVVCSRMVRFWRDPRDIKLAILETLSDYARREDLKGWVKGDETVGAAALADEIGRLSKENADLRNRVSSNQATVVTYDGLTLDELYHLLLRVPVPARFASLYGERLSRIAHELGDSAVGLIHALVMVGSGLRRQDDFAPDTPQFDVVSKLFEYGIVRWARSDAYTLTELGHRFLLRLEVDRDMRLSDGLTLV